MAKIKRNPKAVALANAIIKAYQPTSVGDMNDALKEIFGPVFDGLLQGEMEHHLGYSPHSREIKENDNRRNGYGKKTLKTSCGEVAVQVPRDREGTFEPEIVPKRKRDVSEIENKVLALYARGMSQRDIAQTIAEIYGCSLSHEKVSAITDTILPELEQWQNRPLSKCYAFLFVDCMYVKMRDAYASTKSYAVYTILGYTLQGKKELLGIWLNESESKARWMQIFDEIKARGVEDVFFLSMDGVAGLEEGAKAIFPFVLVQRCMVHLVRNALRYIPSKDYKAFTASLKKLYGAPSLKAFRSQWEAFEQQWARYPGAVAVWARNFQHVEQLFDYGSAIRRIMYTTNSIESVHASFRKVTKKGAFPSENALLKLLYLRAKELQNKWEKGFIPNWSLVMNQLSLLDPLKERIAHYLSIS